MFQGALEGAGSALGVELPGGHVKMNGSSGSRGKRLGKGQVGGEEARGRPGLWGHRAEGSGQRFRGQEPGGRQICGMRGEGRMDPDIWGLGAPEMGTQAHENQGHGRPGSGTQERSATSILDLRRI